jgi:anti-sigma factor ChrR (cupin superfamily)
MNAPMNGHGSHEPAATWRLPHAEVAPPLVAAARAHARGELAAAEREAYALHLESCDVCSGLALAPHLVDETLAALVEPVRPSDAAWHALAARTAPTPASGATPGAGDALDPRSEVQPWKRWQDVPGAVVDGSGPGALAFALATSEGAVFEPTAIAGISTRRLAVDVRNRRITMLVRMEAGTSYPAHRHGGPEECFVVAGDLLVGTVAMHAGDFQRAEAGTVHPVQSTRGGCLLLITSSMDDDLIAA